MPVDTAPDLPIPNPTYPLVALGKVVEFNFGSNRLDLIVSHGWLRLRAGDKVLKEGRMVPGPSTLVQDKTLYRLSLTGDSLGPFLAFLGQDRKALQSRKVIVAGIPVSGLDTVNGHVIQLRNPKAWVPDEAWIAAYEGAEAESLALS